MKNPGCANNRGPPLYTSGSLSYQVAPYPNAPAAMMLRAKAAYGDDDDDSLPRPACVQISTFPSGCLHRSLGCDAPAWSAEVRAISRFAAWSATADVTSKATWTSTRLKRAKGTKHDNANQRTLSGRALSPRRPLGRLGT